MLLVELSGLFAAFCWTLSSLMTPKLVAEFGIMRFNTLRILIAASLLLLIAGLGGRFEAILWQHSFTLILSGVCGIFIGDSMLFAAVHRLGPRRTGVLFATNAPISILLSWLFLNERLTPMELFACALVLTGVVVAILFGKQKQQHAWEDTKGKLTTGVLMALGGALGQASGALLSKPALLEGADAIAVSAIRVTTGAVFLCLAYLFYHRRQAKRPPAPAVTAQTIQITQPKALSDIQPAIYARLFIMASIGMVMGMSVLVWGLGKGNVGLVTTLSATVPVLLLPAIWLTTGQRPALGAWIGAILVVLGASLIVLH